MPEPGKLFIISAPSGAGKTTLVKEVLNTFKNLSYSISHTTRPPREGEKNGIDYYFISRETFRLMIEKDLWLEWAKVHDNYYGTSREFVEQSIAGGQSLILDIDVQGARQIMETGIAHTSIFILPPSMDILKMRLESRGTDSKEVIEKRLLNAKKEMERKEFYKHQVMNDDLAAAKKAICRIFRDEMAQR